jgi:hypothetical protein
MKKPILQVAVFWALLTLAPSLCVAFCSDRQTTAQQLKDSTLVFIGKVLSQETTEGYDEVNVITYHVNVQYSYKGNYPEQVDVITEDSSARYPLKVGEFYLLFAHSRARSEYFRDSTPDQRVLVISSCESNALRNQSDKTRAELTKTVDAESVAEALKEQPAFKQAALASAWISTTVTTTVDQARREPGDGTGGLARVIYDTESLDGYCEMVQLVSWFNDSAPAETVTWNITKRGRKMLPVLGYAYSHPNATLSPKDEDLRKEIICECIRAILKGEKIGYDD